MFDCTRGEPSLFVKGVFDEIPVFKLFARSMMDDSMTLVCVTSEAIQVAGLEAVVGVRRCGGFNG